ncbi:MAG: organomercurial lyase [Acidobacteriota bacterium]
MAHPFSAVATDFLVRIGDRSWYANCVWDGLSILALLGNGTLETHSPARKEPMRFSVLDGQVVGEGLVHFLVPAIGFWDDIGFT